tara:strand:- start:126 stop:296 length:171 start_codon:yes stop_codon:yes gene_type:complete
MHDIVDLLIIKSIEEKIKQQKDERPLLYLDLEENYPEDTYKKEEKKEPSRVIIIDL